MRVLALDTTTRSLSAAVVEDDRVVAERTCDAARTHAEQLPSSLVALLADAGIEIAAIDVFAVAAGPGSFTGLRIGIATAQGFALVLKRKVVAVSVLDALAHAAAGEDVATGAIVASWIDAHRRDVFTALYRIEEGPRFSGERLTLLEAAAVGDPGEALSRWTVAGYAPDLVVGSGAVLYSGIVGERLPAARIVAPPALAPVIGRLASVRARQGDAVDPAGVQPVYVRRPDAEIARDRTEPLPTPRTRR